MKQLIITVIDMTTGICTKSMPLDVIGSEDQALLDAKDGLNKVVDSGSRLTIQVSAKAYTIIPYDILKRSILKAELKDKPTGADGYV